ncbi:hypothetical protein ACHAW6_006484 [Cyclotella cf. meneghiniana]
MNEISARNRSIASRSFVTTFLLVLITTFNAALTVHYELRRGNYQELHVTMALEASTEKSDGSNHPISDDFQEDLSSQLELQHQRRQLSTDVVDKKYIDPRTVTLRVPQPLHDHLYRINPLVRPDGYPWHRWAVPSDGSYPLNNQKFVSILARLGRGENELGDVHPRDYVSGETHITADTIRLYGMVQVFIIRGGKVLRPSGKTGAFVSLIQNAIGMAKKYEDVEPSLKLLTEGDFPLIYDSNDYPWCGDDLVPVFRLNAIKSRKCKHAWPVLSLTYFTDASNIQLLESPYNWDEIMTRWDQAYPWNSKIPKVVWRGRMTGYTYRDGERPRQKLVEYAKSHTDIMDIESTNKNNTIDQDDFQNFMAILDIDGNAWSARFAKLLCYSSVVIKVDPTYVGYWDNEVEPWVHYLPVRADFSDLEKTVRYVINPANAEHISWIIKNAQAFCRTKLTIEQHTVDILWTLLAYAELLAKSSDFFLEWKSNRDAYDMPSLNMKAWPGRGPEAVFKHLQDFVG